MLPAQASYEGVSANFLNIDGASLTRISAGRRLKEDMLLLVWQKTKENGRETVKCMRTPRFSRNVMYDRVWSCSCDLNLQTVLFTFIAFLSHSRYMLDLSQRILEDPNNSKGRKGSSVVT